MSTGTPGSSSGIRLGGAPSTDSAPRRKAALMGRSPQDTAAGAWNYVLLILAIVGSAFPIYWMFIVSTGTDVYLAKIPPPVLPGSNFAHNIGVVLGRASEEGRSYNNAQFGSSMVNSVIVTVIVTVATLFFCSLAGFAFAKLRFKGRDALMVIVILTLTIPNQLGIVALFIIISKFGWQQQLVAVIVPALVSHSACSTCGSSSRTRSPTSWSSPLGWTAPRPSGCTGTSSCRSSGRPSACSACSPLSVRGTSSSGH